MRIRYLTASILFALSLCSAGLAAACPRFGSLLVDFNCDQKYRMVFTGDSIVFGVGDEIHSNSGGYVLRIKQRFTHADVYNFGFPGITAGRLLQYYKTLLTKQPNHPNVRRLATADLLVLDVGRNDFFNRNPPALTVTTIKRLIKFLNTELKQRFGTAPLITNTFLLPTNRGFDTEFISSVNALMLKLRGRDLPTYLRFDLLDPTLLSDDGLHPTSAGYDFLAKLMEEYILDDAQVRSSLLRPDTDHDGIYDAFEKSKFKTKPKVADTDGDGVLDGAEVFTYKTDPTNPDTDGDSMPDGLEIQQGSDPLTPDFGEPLPSPTPTPTLTPDATSTPLIGPTPTPTQTPVP